MISATNSAAQPASQQQTTQQSKSSGLTSDFETFLLMLTTQARNQDPLKPLDSSEYASQLAQFSMVEQQVQTNEMLATLTQAMGSVKLEELSNWVGMDVRAASAFQFDNTPVEIFANPEDTADKAVLVIKDAEGTVIDRITVSATEKEFTWAGMDESGNPLPSGNYSASLESYKDGKLQSDKPASVYSRVVEAQVSEGTIILKLEGGTVISARDVTAVRAGA
ncbi:flagellar hook capping FlgD N-terminal domain-containing protein [Ruegeria arenilitoris]|uniref:flagellar hook capping FlgD N-terminal domain-containing protein n=1 Tax=Ruegeria arenilitoris TaxID=1173585 RepID=UPI00147F8DE5|nr:flagellar hook capping FlgD N-terminal domain-containing protein [Ruegeria arenilitoris]